MSRKKNNHLSDGEKLDKLNRIYEIVENSDSRESYNWHGYHMSIYLQEILKYGRSFEKTEQYNKNINKLLIQLAKENSFYELFYIKHNKPKYVYDLNLYCDELDVSNFIREFEGKMREVKHSPTYYHIQEIPLYMKILQHYNAGHYFSEAMKQHYLDYIKNDGGIIYALSWFFMTEDSTPSMDSAIIECLIDHNVILHFNNKCQKIFSNSESIIDQSRNVLDYQGFYYVFNHDFNVRDRIFKNLPKELQLGVIL